MTDLVRADGLPVIVYRRIEPYAGEAGNPDSLDWLSIHAELRSTAWPLRLEHRNAWRLIVRGMACGWMGRIGNESKPIDDPIAWLLAEFTDGADGASADVEEAAGDALADRGDRA